MLVSNFVLTNFTLIKNLIFVDGLNIEMVMV